MVFKKCCCCLDLRIGCLIIGVLQILGGLGNFKPPLEWYTIITAIVNIVAGACLLFGAIKYNPIGTLINLITTAIAVIFVFIVAIMAFVVAGALGSHSDEFLVYIIAGAVYLVAVAIEIYLWLCIFSFYKELKSGAIIAPGTGV